MGEARSRVAGGKPLKPPMDSKVQATLVCTLVACAFGTLEDPETPPPQGLSLDSPFLTSEFDTVQNFRLTTDGMRETVKDEEACRQKCLQHDSCRSYSWSEHGTKDKPGRTCVSAKKIGFDPNWVFHTRTYAIDSTGALQMS